MRVVAVVALGGKGRVLCHWKAARTQVMSMKVKVTIIGAGFIPKYLSLQNMSTLFCPPLKFLD